MEKAIVKAAACLSIAAIIISISIKDSGIASFISLFAFIAIGIIATKK